MARQQTVESKLVDSIPLNVFMETLNKSNTLEEATRSFEALRNLEYKRAKQFVSLRASLLRKAQLPVKQFPRGRTTENKTDRSNDLNSLDELGFADVLSETIEKLCTKYALDCQIHTFEDCGLNTGHAGLVIKIGESTFQIPIVQTQETDDDEDAVA